jgi:hypothetical protein
MSAERMRNLIVVICCALTAGRVVAQVETPYAVVVSAAGGYTRNVSKFDATPPGLRQDGFVGTLRVMWKPEYRLSLGIETGFTHVYRVDADDYPTEFGPIDIYTSQNAVPILGMVSMYLGRGLTISGGAGIFLLSSESRIVNSTTSPTVVSGGIAAALAYMLQLSDDWSAGTEFKWYNLDKFNDNNLSLQMVFSYRLFEW